MPPHLRFDRQGHEGWTLAEGPDRLGEVHPDHMTFVGFRDATSAGIAASIATNVLKQWQVSRRSVARADIVVHLTPDNRGFRFDLPDGLWHALLLELAQRIHAATRSLRHLEPEPVA